MLTLKTRHRYVNRGRKSGMGGVSARQVRSQLDRDERRIVAFKEDMQMEIFLIRSAEVATERKAVFLARVRLTSYIDRRSNASMPPSPLLHALSALLSAVRSTPACRSAYPTRLVYRSQCLGDFQAVHATVNRSLLGVRPSVRASGTRRPAFTLDRHRN